MDDIVYALSRIADDAEPGGQLEVTLQEGPRTERAKHPPRWRADRVRFEMPPDSTVSFATASDLWIGTESLGVLRSGNEGASWFQLHDLAEGADRLTVACASAEECYLATGGARAFAFRENAFSDATIDVEPGSRVLALVRDSRGHVVAIHRGARGNWLRLSRVNQGAWSAISMQEIAVPEGSPELTFAAFGPPMTGWTPAGAVKPGAPAAASYKGTAEHLWLGLQYRDKADQPHFHGAAEVDVDSARVQYHRQFPKGTSPPPGALPIPNDCTAVFFAPGTIWFATKSGAVRVDSQMALAAGGGTGAGQTAVRIFTENDGLESELLRDVEAGPAPGKVWVATDRGLGLFDGAHWMFQKQGPLSWRARALALAPDGRLWVATDHGLVAVSPSGTAERTYDHSSGLLEDDTRDVAVDSLGRVWVLSPKGLGLVDPSR
jgi:ligand-binding sensor domain-containing protein